MIEIGEHLEINVTRINNGFLVSLGRSEGYRSTHSPQSYYRCMDDIRTELSSMLDAALALKINADSGPDF